MAQIPYEVKEEHAAAHKAVFTVIPPGWYKVVIVGSEIKATKNGDGKMLELKYELHDGTKREMVDRLNIINPSAVAQRIAQGALSKICIAIGQKTLTDSNLLHGRPFEAKIAVVDFESNKEGDIDPETGKQRMLKSNKVDDYRAVQAGAATAPTNAVKPPMAF